MFQKLLQHDSNLGWRIQTGKLVAEISEEEVKGPPVSNKKLGLFSPAPFRPEAESTERIRMMRMAVIGIMRNNSYDVSGE